MNYPHAVYAVKSMLLVNGCINRLEQPTDEDIESMILTCASVDLHKAEEEAHTCETHCHLATMIDGPEDEQEPLVAMYPNLDRLLDFCFDIT
jgi:hypothetical protein